MKEQSFDSKPEFQYFKKVMKGVIAVPKERLNAMVQAAKDDSPRTGDPDAPGRKRVRKRASVLPSGKNNPRKNKKSSS